MLDDDNFKISRKNRPARSRAQIAIVALAAVLVIGTLLAQAVHTGETPQPTATASLTPTITPTLSPTLVPTATWTSTPIAPRLSVNLVWKKELTTNFLADVAWIPLDGPNGGKLASTGGGRMNFYDPLSPNGSPPSMWIWLLDPGNMVTFNPAGTLAAFIKGADVSLVDLATGRQIALLEGHTRKVNDVAFSPDGTLVATVGWDNMLRLWEINAETGTYTQVAAVEHPYNVSSVAFSPDGEFIATGCYDSHLRLWNTQNILRGSQVPQIDRELHQGRVTALAISPDGRIVASGGGDNRVYLYDVDDDDFSLLGQHSSGDEVTALSFSPDGRLLASSGGNTFSIWDVAAGVELIHRFLDTMRDVAFSPDGRWLVAVSDHYRRGSRVAPWSTNVSLWSVSVEP